VLTSKVDLKQSRDKKVTPLNHIFRDRRVDLYRELRKGKQR